MVRWIREFAAFTAAGLVGSAALADVPSPTHSTAPSYITLVGSRAGVPDSASGQFAVVVRGLTDNTFNGAAVVLDLSGCSDAAICSDQLDSGALVNCAAKTIRRFTNALGEVTFTALGGSNGSGMASTTTGCAGIYANGTFLRFATVSVLDLDGVNGVGANDLSVWLADFGTGIPYGRDDYDHDGRIGANDLSVWLNAFGSGASGNSCTSSCP
jgi:hypothetical protein